MEKFEIKGEYIELKKLLKAAGMLGSGGISKAVIEDGLVMVDGEVETRKGCKLRPGQVVEFEGESIEIA